MQMVAANGRFIPSNHTARLLDKDFINQRDGCDAPREWRGRVTAWF
jgi:hypothetical protein